MRLLFEGGHYNIQGLAGGGYYSRVATIRGRLLFEEIRYAALAGAKLGVGIQWNGNSGMVSECLFVY